MNVIFQSNDNVIELSSLANGLTGTAISSATVTVSLLDADGAAVTATGVSWPLTMVAASGSTGTYRATLPYTLPLATGTYTAQVLATASGMHAEWNVPLRATARTG